MNTGKGYSITTYRFRLRCGHPEWLTRTQELYDGIVKFYYDLLLDHEELWEQGSQETLRSLEYLSLPGKEKRRPQAPLPWEDIPPYFRRAAINSGIAAAKSFLTRKRALEGLYKERENPGSSPIVSSSMESTMLDSEESTILVSAESMMYVSEENRMLIPDADTLKGRKKNTISLLEGNRISNPEAGTLKGRKKNTISLSEENRMSNPEADTPKGWKKNTISLSEENKVPVFEKDTSGEFRSENRSEKDMHDDLSYAKKHFSPRAEVPAEEIRSAVVYYSRMYREFSSQRITLKVWTGETWCWMNCRLSGREFPPDAKILSPSVVWESPFFMLHVPVREQVEDVSPVKKRMREGGNVCGLQFTNGDAFAAASVCDADGNEIAVKFFNGGREYRHHCEKVLERIRCSTESLGNSPEGPANRKYWMHLKHLREHYAHQASREIVRFCEQNQVSMIVLPKYKSDYVWKVMRGAGNWSPLHLSFRIRSYLRYKAWQSGILVLESYAGGAGTTCARCGRPLLNGDGKSKEYVCPMGHRGNRYLNTARNLAVNCRRQFQERDSG